LIVSDSIVRFLDGITNVDVQLVGSCFWKYLCDDSTRRLKAAFMDSLAARHEEDGGGSSSNSSSTGNGTSADTVPLGTGVWEVQLVDPVDGSLKPVSLHGVVHFAGDRPECVCTIRHRHDGSGAGETASAGDSSGSKRRPSAEYHHHHHHHHRNNNNNTIKTVQDNVDASRGVFVRISDSAQSSSTSGGEDSETSGASHDEANNGHQHHRVTSAVVAAAANESNESGN
jgi:hypothetical protein